MAQVVKPEVRKRALSVSDLRRQANMFDTVIATNLRSLCLVLDRSHVAEGKAENFPVDVLKSVQTTGSRSENAVTSGRIQ
jgi:hypothetical protein